MAAVWVSLNWVAITKGVSVNLYIQIICHWNVPRHKCTRPLLFWLLKRSILSCLLIVKFLQVCGQWCWKSGHACIGEAYCLQCYSCDHFR
jgi:hypothetical protein